MTRVQQVTLVAALFLWVSVPLFAQTKIGDVFVGTCDGTPFNTQLNEVDAFTPEGQFQLAFNGAHQNSCTTAMSFDTADNLHVISALFGPPPSWEVLKFDNLAHLLQHVPFPSPLSITHDQQGNFYLGAGNVIKITPGGTESSFAVLGGAEWVTLLSDQQTLIYSAANGDVKSFNVHTMTAGPDFATGSVAQAVRALPDNSLLLDSNGAIQHWVSSCPTCYPYRMLTAYQIPANATGMALDPDGVSFWTINSYYDQTNKLGHGDVYRTNIETGSAMASFSLPALSNGRYYSGTIGINGDGMNTTDATSTASLTFGGQAVGTTSGAKSATFTNTGPVVMVASKFTVTDDSGDCTHKTQCEFAIKRNGCQEGVLPISGSCNITVTFSPTQSSTRNGTLVVYDNASNSPQTVTLSGLGKGVTMTTLSSNPNPAVFGQSVNFLAHVGTNGSAAPTGMVTFFNGTKALGSSTLNSENALFSTSKLPAGTLSIVAKYAGDLINYRSPPSAPVMQVVTTAVTSTTVTSSRNPSKHGALVKFTATVFSQTTKPTGTVTFMAGGTNLGTFKLVNGKAAVSTSTLSLGTTTVTATYNGTANITGSAGSIAQTVQ